MCILGLFYSEIFFFHYIYYYFFFISPFSVVSNIPKEHKLNTDRPVGILSLITEVHLE